MRRRYTVVALACALLFLQRSQVATASTCDDGQALGSDNSTCYDCPPGQSTNGIARNTAVCSPCAAGRYACRGTACSRAGILGENSEALFCTPCAIGYYQNEQGQASCVKCPTNQYTIAMGSASPEACLCKEGTYITSGYGYGAWSVAGNAAPDDNDNPNAYTVTNASTAGPPSSSSSAAIAGVQAAFVPSVCNACPTGAVCLGADARPYGKSKQSFDVGTDNRDDWYRCRTGLTESCGPSVRAGRITAKEAAKMKPNGGCSNPCLPGNLTHPSNCKMGTEGRLCSRCQDGWFRLGRDCMKCGGFWNPTVLKVIYVFLLLPTFYMIRKLSTNDFRTNYLLFVYLQLFAMLGSFRMKWAPDVKNFMRWIQVVNFNVDLLMPFCNEEMSFTQKYIAFTIFPIFFFVADAVKLYLKRVIRHLRGELDDPDEMPILEELQRILLVDIRMFYVTLSARTFDMLSCTPMGDGRHFLTQDPQVICWEGAHLRIIPLVAFALAVYVVGIPLLYAYVLLKGRQQKRLYTKMHVRKFGRIYSRFEQEYFYWELIIFARRLGIVVVKVFLDDRRAFKANMKTGAYQGIYAICVLSAALLAHFYARPFEDWWQDFLDCVLMMALMGATVCGLLFTVASIDTGMGVDERTFEGTRVCFYIIFAFAMVVVVVSLFRDFMILRQKKAKAKMLRRLNTAKPPSSREAPAEDDDVDGRPGTDGYGRGNGAGAEAGSGGKVPASDALDGPGASKLPSSLVRLQSIARTVQNEESKKKMFLSIFAPSEATVNRWNSWLGVDDGLQTLETAALDMEEKHRHHHHAPHTHRANGTANDRSGAGTDARNRDDFGSAASPGVVPGLGGGGTSNGAGGDIEAGGDSLRGDVAGGGVAMDAGLPAGRGVPGSPLPRLGLSSSAGLGSPSLSDQVREMRMRADLPPLDGAVGTDGLPAPLPSPLTTLTPRGARRKGVPPLER